jgi:hypothetical protein
MGQALESHRLTRLDTAHIGVLSRSVRVTHWSALPSPHSLRP